MAMHESKPKQCTVQIQCRDMGTLNIILGFENNIILGFENDIILGFENNIFLEFDYNIILGFDQQDTLQPYASRVSL